MNETNYKALLDQALTKHGELTIQRDAITIEMAKQLEFINALVNMLSDEDSREFKARVAEVVKKQQNQEASLIESIRLVLQKAGRGQFLTAAQVRDRLVNSGFNFGDYTSNPLASVSTTLRRLKPEEVETAEINSVTAYRWVGWVKLSELPKPPKSGYYRTDK